MRQRPDKWKLDGTTPVPMRDDELLAWAEWYEKADRIVKQEYAGPYFISTVFLGLDHNFARNGPPILFETMIFSDFASLSYQERCSTWEEALAMHQRGVEWATIRKEHWGTEGML